jgi:isopenicillin-N N-acyltransferase like protein
MWLPGRHTGPVQGREIRVLELVGDAVDRGEVHGSAHAEEIREYAADRVRLSGIGTELDRSALLDLAGQCLPAHADYAPDLYEEMLALASSAGLAPAEAMIVGGYTDFIDTVRAYAGSGPVEDNCTAVMVPDPAAVPGGGFLAQTWDMHASATPHIVMLGIRPEHGPAALVFSTVGCLGQIGMNEAGIAVGINNLSADDGRVGVTWPFVVRRALQQTDLDAAVAAIVDADLAGAHNFLVFDAAGRGVNIEAMPSTCRIIEVDAEPYFHTNHCLTSEAAVYEAPRPPDLIESSERRLVDAAALLTGGPVSEQDLMAMTRDENWICRHPSPPFDYETCGAAIMRPATREFWACWGVPSENEYERFVIG